MRTTSSPQPRGSTPGWYCSTLDLNFGRVAAGRRVDGVELVEPLLAAGWRVLVLTGSPDHTRIGAALAAGALAWVPKHASFPTLLAAVRSAVAG